MQLSTQTLSQSMTPRIARPQGLGKTAITIAWAGVSERENVSLIAVREQRRSPQRLDPSVSVPVLPGTPAKNLVRACSESPSVVNICLMTLTNQYFDIKVDSLMSHGGGWQLKHEEGFKSWSVRSVLRRHRVSCNFCSDALQ